MGESFGTLNVRVTLEQKSMGKGGMEKMYTMREKLTRNCQYIQKVKVIPPKNGYAIVSELEDSRK
jgi:hypothetical protein